jgi:ribosomal protein S27E
MITIPIRLSSSPGPVLPPRRQNATLIRIACPRCGQHLSATYDQIGMTAPCQSCNEVITVPIQHPTSTTLFAAASESTQNRYVRRGLSSNRHATLLDCSRCNRWHSTSHRGQTHGDRNVHLSLRECDNQRHQNLPYLRSTLSITAAVVSG